MNLVVFGPPGSRKGHPGQNAVWKSVTDMVQLSTGDMLRAEVASETVKSRGKQAKAING